jgi:4-hydroxy-tetrahydrodipicolinate reductase
MPLRVGVFGAGGRMGSAVCAAVAADPELELVAAVDPFHSGIDLRQVTGVDLPMQLAPGPEVFTQTDVEVVVDFTSVDAARGNVQWLAEHGIHGVVGTTGLTDADYAAFRAVFTTSNCVVAPNFAIGAVLMCASQRWRRPSSSRSRSSSTTTTRRSTRLRAPR